MMLNFLRFLYLMIEISEKSVILSTENPERYIFDGKLEMDPNCRIGYVSQFSQIQKIKDTTVYEYIGKEFIKLQNEITSICTEMETSSNIDTLLEKYQQALDAFNAIGGDDFESIINKKLNLANLTKHKDLMVSELSGGEFKLIQVIKEMLSNPDLKGAILMISHDYYFISNCMDYVLIIEDKTLRKMSMKKFRRKIYANHFDRDYLEVEQKKKSIETKIELALKDTYEYKKIHTCPIYADIYKVQEKTILQ